MKINELNGKQEQEGSEEENYYFSLLDFYKKEKKKVHVEMLNGRFYNGMVLKVTNNSFILEDVNLGKMPIFFLQIKIVEAYKQR